MSWFMYPFILSLKLTKCFSSALIIVTFILFIFSLSKVCQLPSFVSCLFFSYLIKRFHCHLHKFFKSSN
jgi:hypothetical protein